ncbi:MAG: DUF1289 domain-containing protein [Caldimonas sp.]
MTGVLRAAKAATVPSPCVDVCRIDARTGWCEGCFRTIDEIAAWGALDDRARRTVWKLLPARRQAFGTTRDAT